MDLSTPVNHLPGTGPVVIGRLKKLKIYSIRDLLFHLPFRYENLGETRKIAEISIGEMASVSGQVEEIRNLRTKFGKFLTRAVINDGSDTIEAVWFNQPFLTKSIKPTVKLSLAGKVDFFSHRPTLINPDYEVMTFRTNPSIHTQGLIPIYPETLGLTSKWFRRKIREIIPLVSPRLKEALPETLIKKHNLVSLAKAFSSVHNPESESDINNGQSRLAFDELIYTHLSSLQRRESWKSGGKAVKVNVPTEKIAGLISDLPFDLTSAQKKVLREIFRDLQSSRPMNRLLQGDVGSGKTIVASICAYAVFLNGFKSILMAPTEILAFQHYKTIRSILEPLGVNVGLRTSSRKLGENFDFLVGTHALLANKAVFGNPALVVIDEQHRFGVEQRALLRQKSGTPHLLTMTATPIPRSLALTLYGNLDISIIDEMPIGRMKVKTYLVPPEKRSRAYEFIRNNVKKGGQVFMIFPFIDPSETLSSVKAAVKEFEFLKKEVFPDLRMGLLHGRMKGKEKEKAVSDFAKKEIDILVSTPVVEVGIDIPNANIMVIEGSERFGLASLHQLRGRVGRGQKQSYCLLFTESNNSQVIKRLRSMEKYTQGLKLSEIDLKLRGPGQLYGLAQSGLLQFKVASLADLDLIQVTKNEAESLFKKVRGGKLPVLKTSLENKEMVSPD